MGTSRAMARRGVEVAVAGEEEVEVAGAVAVEGVEVAVAGEGVEGIECFV
jgi:hypothetical protein